MGRFADALREGLGRKYERRYPVELAVVIGAGQKDGYTNVAILRPDGSQGERKDVRSDKSIWPGVIVRVTTQRQLFGEEEESIAGIDLDTYASSSTVPTLMGKHGQQHGHEQQDEVSLLHHYQTYPLRVQALTGLTIRIQDGLYYADGGWHTLNGYVDVDMTPSKPGSNERWVLLTLTAAGSVTLANGATAATVQRTSIPDPPAGEYPVGAIKLTSATTTIVRADIDDIRHLRPFIADVLPALGTAFQRLRVNAGATALEHFTDQAGILVSIGGAGVDITAGSKGYLTVPFDCKIIEWFILGDNALNQIVVDLKLDAGFPAAGALPTTASMAGSEKPTLATAGSNSDLSLTTWTTQVLAGGDVIEVVVDSVGGTKPQLVSITLVVEKR